LFKPAFLSIFVGFAFAGFAVCAHAGTLPAPPGNHEPYVVPTEPGWEVVALMNAGDSARNVVYRMVGVPDGMGALRGRFEADGRYVDDHGHITVLINHELAPGLGIRRGHGHDGAFVSQWTIQLDSLRAVRGEDLIRRVRTWTEGRYVEGSAGARLSRFCSGDLPPVTAFRNPASGKGFAGRIYMNGEENGSEGRAFAHVVSGPERGTSYELPYLGKFSWENALAHPNAGDRTIVVGLDDSAPGQIRVYVGDKRASGNPVERAGLHEGKLYGVRIIDGGPDYENGPVAVESAGPINGRFELVDISAHATGKGGELQNIARAAGVTGLARPEDGHWDTRNPKVFYWVTTGATFDGRLQSARLYRLTFDSLVEPRGGSIEMVVDSAALTGRDGQPARNFDNMVVDGHGDIIVQEDPGNDPYLAKIWKIDPVKRTGVQIFEANRKRFAPGGSGFLTQDEEHSGVIDVTEIVSGARWYQPGRRYYLGNTQAHYAIPGERVEGGQLYLLASPKAMPGRAAK
jgi:hypothetical protein